MLSREKQKKGTEGRQILFYAPTTIVKEQAGKRR